MSELINNVLSTVIVSGITVGAVVKYFGPKCLDYFFKQSELRIKQSFKVNNLKFEAIEERLNNESNLYVSTITKERIEWLEVVRNDFAKIVGASKAIMFHCKYTESASKTMKMILVSNGMKYSDKGEKLASSYFEVQFKKEEQIKKLNEYITLLCLRMNPKEDSIIINKLISLKEIFDGEIEEESVKKTLKELDPLIRNMLKEEWEKVKEEIDYRGNIKDKK